VRSLEEAVRLAGDDGLTVAGGGQVYTLALPYATGMCLTYVDGTVADADTWFPRFDTGAWTEVKRTHHPADERHAYAFDWVDYVRA
jgi:dihydrofolate reductase